MKNCYYIILDTEIYTCETLSNNFNVGNFNIFGSIAQYMTMQNKSLPVLFSLNDAIVCAKKLINNIIEKGTSDNNTMKNYPILGAIILKIELSDDMKVNFHKDGIMSLKLNGRRDYNKLLDNKLGVDISVYQTTNIVNNMKVYRGVIHNNGMEKMKVVEGRYVLNSNNMNQQIGFSILNSYSHIKGKHIKKLKEMYDAKDSFVKL
jgi:hypothetical protein